MAASIDTHEQPQSDSKNETTNAQESSKQDKELEELRAKFENVTINKLKNRHRKELQDFQNEWKKQLKTCKKGDKRTLQRSKKQQENDLRNSHKNELNSFEKYTNLLKEENGPTMEEIERQKEEIEYKLRMKFFIDKKRAKQEKYEKMKQFENNENNKDENAINLGKEETKMISNILSQLGFDIYDIATDGHCLYRAIEHQLSILFSKNDKFCLNYLELRKLCHDFMIENSKLFLPFFINDNGQLMTHDEFKEYADRIIDYDTIPVMWGGHNEIVALSRALDMPIIIHAAYNRPQIVYHKDHSKLDGYWHSIYDKIHKNEIKTDNKNNDDDNDDEDDTRESKENGSNDNKDDENDEKMAVIHLSYHENLYTLGEHYNSVVTKKYKEKETNKNENQWKTAGNQKSKKKRR